MSMKPAVSALALAMLLAAAPMPGHAQTTAAATTAAATTTATPAPARLNDADLAKAVTAQLAVMGDDFSGAVLVARRGKTIVAAAQGLADRERGLPNTVNTRFRVGSLDKTFTGLAILQLVQAGKLDLQAPLATYLTDYPNADFARRVTLHQLLTHTGGAGDIFGPEYDAHRDQLRTLEDYVRLYGARAPDFAPGSQCDYSNYGYILLGRVIEEVSGQSYYDYLQSHVFGPAGMTGTGFEPESVAVPGRAVGYEKAAADYKPVSDLPWRGTSAGGGYSTVEDFSRFVTALYDGRLLDAEHRALMTQGRVDAEAGMRYGYGLATYVGARPAMIGHNGIAPGMHGDLRILGDGEGVIVVLSNVAPPFVSGRLGKFISSRFSAP
jgi:CubicO group peptidase (beta-lactamase class C family)